MKLRHFTTLCCLIILARVSPAFAETQQYLSQQEALELVLGTNCQIEHSEQRLLEPVKEKLQQFSANTDATIAHFFICRRNGAIAGYALIDNEIGKHMPITYIIGFDSSGKVTRTEVMVFREVIGWQVKNRSFLSQFDTASDAKQLVVGKQIQNITGATYSSKAIAKGVRRALILWQEFFGLKK